MTRALTLILSATLAAACAGQSADRIGYATSASPPVLIAISPGVEVVANEKEPVFRASNAYWLYRGDRWYRTVEPGGGPWMQIGTPPHALASLGDPQQYVGTRADTRAVQDRTLSTQRTERMQREPLSPVPDAPYPRPPQQQPPVPVDGPGTTDQVPHDPTTLSQPGPSPTHPRATQVPADPDDEGRPDPIRN